MMKRLSPREKLVVGSGAMILLLFFAWFMLIQPYLSTMERLERKIVATRHSLAKAQAMSSQINQLRQQLKTVKTPQRNQRPLLSRVESLTETTGVREQLLSMRPQPVTTQGEFRQQLVEISLKKISLLQLTKLLHAIEYRSGGIQVKSMQIRSRFENRSLLDVNMILMSLEGL